jgi:hypothetical protein
MNDFHDMLQIPLLAVLYAIYYSAVLFFVINGGVQELFGHTKGGHQHSRLHRVLWQWHTGLHVHPHRSYGDESHRKRSANAVNRTTPEGAIVYWSSASRPTRALRNNLASLGVITLVYGMLFDTRVSVQILTVVIVVAAFAVLALLLQRLRVHVSGKPVRKIITNPMAKKAVVGASPLVQEAKATTHYVAGGTVTEDKPQMDGGIPQQVLGMLISDALGVSAAEAVARLSLSPDRGALRLPDSFPALQRQRDTIEEIISAQNSAKLRFAWRTSTVPRVAEWIPVITTMPTQVFFRDHLAALEKLPLSQFGVGLSMERTLFVADHGGDTPWHLRCAGSGTGKSTGFLVKAAQICHRYPDADLYCWDSKQVSFEDLHGIPGVYIYDDPVSAMPSMYQGFYDLANIMRERYTMVRRRQATYADFNDIWVLVDEGNDLASQFKTYYQKDVKKSSDPAQPLVWAEAIAALVYQGRQVGIRGEWMFQNMTDRALGGVSLRDAFPVVGMAGYKKNQWSRIIGTSPVPDCKNGPGKICMVHGPDQQWVQGFWDEPQYLREYAMASRKGRTAA